MKIGGRFSTNERKTCAGKFFKPYHFALKPVRAEKNIIFGRQIPTHERKTHEAEKFSARLDSTKNTESRAAFFLFFFSLFYAF